MATTEQFLSAVLPSQGFRFLFMVMPDGKTPQWDYQPSEIDEQLKLASWGVSKQADVYFAVGAFAPSIADGTLSRTAKLAYLHRCLRLDLDVGAAKPYATKADAVKALAAFCHAYQLPAPWIVDSGYGVHVYWAFDRDVDLREWLAMADQLRTACGLQGLQADPTTTTDAARVLRLPGTFNFKRGSSAPVRILAAGAAASPEFLRQCLPSSGVVAGVIPGLGAVPAALAGAVGEDLSAHRFPGFTLRGILQQCPGMANMLRTGGATAHEPLWKLALDLINKADDLPHVKERVARAVSAGHPNFSEGEFANKWAQTQSQDHHPPTCQKMADIGLPECTRCPLRGSIKTPVSLGRATLPPPPAVAPCAQPAIPLPPMPPTAALVPQPMLVQQLGIFLITGGFNVPVVDGNLTRDIGVRDGLPSHRMVIKEKLQDGTEGEREWWAPIINYRILEVERLLDAVGKQSLTVITFDRNSDGVWKVEFTQKALSEPQTFATTLYAQGIHVTRKQAALLQDLFMPEFLSQLQRARAANQIAGRCGWTDDRTGFVLGTRLFQRGSIQHVRPGTAPEEMEAYHAAGDEVLWRKAFDLTLSGGPDRQAVLALAIAAPLMVFTGLDGVMVNAYSPESGVGKSTLCDAALSIWGAPEKLRKDFRDTANATFKLASVVGNLPMVVDEFTNIEGKALSDYIYTITQGREKHRLGADSKLNTTGTRWCLPAIVTSNNSIHDKLQAYRGDAAAEAARVFELRLRPLTMDMAAMGAAKSDLLALRSNYGMLGARIVELLLARDPDYWRAMVVARISWWDAQVSQDAGDRFRAAACALIDIGCVLGAAMGFGFDRAAVMHTIRGQWGEQQVEFEAGRTHPGDFVNTYIVEHLSDFLVLGGPDSSSIVTNAPRRFFGEIRGKSLNGKYTAANIIIPLDLLRDHVRERNGNFKAVTEWLRDELGRKDGIVSRMGKLLFLEGQFHQINTPAVEFKAGVLGSATLKLASVDGATVPTQLVGIK
jgi:hypothetical protein